jgi:two-component system nitrate/nitrite response regulator NarL
MVLADMGNSPVRILLVDDYEPYRQKIRSILEMRPELQVIGEALDGLEAVRKAEELHPDLILLDVSLPTFSGIEAASRISHSVPGSKILFVSSNTDAEVVRTALSNGAQGYVHKADAGTELLPAIKVVLQGSRYVSRGMKGDDCSGEGCSGEGCSDTGETEVLLCGRQ